MALTTNLVSFWEFEEATAATRLDSVVATGNDLTSVNSVTQETGEVGFSAGFTLSPARSLTHADTSTLEPGDQDFSIAFWGYLVSKLVVGTFVAKYTTTLNQRSYLVQYDFTTDRFQFLMTPDGLSGTVVTLSATSFGSPTSAIFYFIVASYDATANLMSISVNNGTVDTASETGGAFSGTAIFTVGSIGNPANNLNGRVDQLGIWIGRKLSAAEITQLYNGGSGLSYAAMVALSGGGILMPQIML